MPWHAALCNHHFGFLLTRLVQSVENLGGMTASPCIQDNIPPWLLTYNPLCNFLPAGAALCQISAWGSVIHSGGAMGRTLSGSGRLFLEDFRATFARAPLPAGTDACRNPWMTGRLGNRISRKLLIVPFRFIHSWFCVCFCLF